MAEENGTILCQKCGAVARFNVIVTHNRVNGQWCRTACSRNCAGLLVDDGCRELMSTTNGGGSCNYSINPILTGKSPGIVVK